MKKVLLWCAGLLVVLGLVILVVPSFRAEAVSVKNCVTLARGGLRAVADDRADRFLGKVQPYTAECRGGAKVARTMATPWVDWSNYWGTGDETSRSPFRLAVLQRLGPDQRGIDGALLDLEYQRIELIKFNLFDNATFTEYVNGREGRGGRSLAVWPQMRLSANHPNYEDVGGDGEQLCGGALIRSRTLSGICNDVRNPIMGAAGTEFARNVQFEETYPDLGLTPLTRARHAGRIDLMTPDPGLISRKLFTREIANPAVCNEGQGLPGDPLEAECDYLKAPFFNVLAAFWIQFMTHDWFNHLEEGANSGEQMAMGCATEEARALGCRAGDRIDRALVNRSEPAPTFADGAGQQRLARAHRTTRNSNTAWWDASQIYGYDSTSLARVKRDPRDQAKLEMVQAPGREQSGDRMGYLPVFEGADPINQAWSGQEAAAFPDNWTIGLSFYHNLFVREHNLFVEHFRAHAAAHETEDSGLRDPERPQSVIRYSDVTDEELFQVARLVVAAEIAKIHTIEWTTQLLYNEPLYNAMNANWHGLFRDKDLASRAMERVLVEALGSSPSERDRTLWFSVFASGSGIFGLGSRRYEDQSVFSRFLPRGEDVWDVTNPDHVNGGINHFGSPFNFPEEFVTVYRLHPLVPDLLEYRELDRDPNAVTRKVPVGKTFRGGATQAMREGGLSNWALTMGRQRLGALTLMNHPSFLQNVPMPRLGSETNLLDVAALDIVRDRERGIPRFNEFRRQYGLQSLSGFDDFIDVRLPSDSPERARQEEFVRRLREVYGQHTCDASLVISHAQRLGGEPVTDCLGHPDRTTVDNIEDLDTVVGWLAESTRPHGFAISETQFTVFIVNASRRLFSDRFFTSSFRPEFYSHLGVAWVNDNGPDGTIMEAESSNGHHDEVSPLKRVILRAIPELAGELEGVVNMFDPWARDRGDYYSVEWAPRAGRESDPAFRAPGSH